MNIVGFANKLAGLCLAEEVKLAKLEGTLAMLCHSNSLAHTLAT